MYHSPLPSPPQKKREIAWKEVQPLVLKTLSGLAVKVCELMVD